jgi:hypothetical protein
MIDQARGDPGACQALLGQGRRPVPKPSAKRAVIQQACEGAGQLGHVAPGHE